ncbi:MAG: hypothetical protein LBS71_00800 [Puniceicoccales bacterium]|jgi:hypothetical protein|nr:hypothetical protein [Puniceicoccales bacterium]
MNINGKIIKNAISGSLLMGGLAGIVSQGYASSWLPWNWGSKKENASPSLSQKLNTAIPKPPALETDQSWCDAHNREIDALKQRVDSDMQNFLLALRLVMVMICPR